MPVLNRIEFKGNMECACGAPAVTISLELRDTWRALDTIVLSSELGGMSVDKTDNTLKIVAADCGRVADSGCIAPVCGSCDRRCDERHNAGICCLCFYRGVFDGKQPKWDRDDLCKACCERYDSEPREEREYGYRDGPERGDQADPPEDTRYDQAPQERREAAE